MGKKLSKPCGQPVFFRNYFRYLFRKLPKRLHSHLYHVFSICLLPMTPPCQVYVSQRRLVKPQHLVFSERSSSVKARPESACAILEFATIKSCGNQAGTNSIPPSIQYNRPYRSSEHWKNWMCRHVSYNTTSLYMFLIKHIMCTGNICKETKSAGIAHL